MDGLIVLLIIIGIISKLAKKEQKRKKQASDSPAQPAQSKPTHSDPIPFTREEWAKYLKQAGIPGAEEKAAKAAEGVEKLRKAQPQARPAVKKAVVAPAVQPALQHDEPEGTISTQGESRAEHAAHRRRILEEEARLQKEKNALEELRNANLEKLRSAVIMSEVLGKPVALRGKRW